MSEGFVSKYLDKANAFERVMLKQIDFFKKLQGTKVIVSRYTDDNKYKSVYGSLFNSDLLGEEGKKSFEYVVLINMHDMKKLYQRTIDSIEFYDNKDIIKQGDLLTYSRGGNQYQFKVTSVDTWSDDSLVLNRYTLTGLRESTTEQNGNC